MFKVTCDLNLIPRKIKNSINNAPAAIAHQKLIELSNCKLCHLDDIMFTNLDTSISIQDGLKMLDGFNHWGIIYSRKHNFKFYEIILNYHNIKSLKHEYLLASSAHTDSPLNEHWNIPVTILYQKVYDSSTHKKVYGKFLDMKFNTRELYVNCDIVDCTSLIDDKSYDYLPTLHIKPLAARYFLSNANMKCKPMKYTEASCEDKLSGSHNYAKFWLHDALAKLNDTLFIINDTKGHIGDNIQAIQSNENQVLWKSPQHRIEERCLSSETDILVQTEMITIKCSNYKSLIIFDSVGHIKDVDYDTVMRSLGELQQQCNDEI